MHDGSFCVRSPVSQPASQLPLQSCVRAHPWSMHASLFFSSVVEEEQTVARRRCRRLRGFGHARRESLQA
jgi:hypothetical protein